MELQKVEALELCKACPDLWKPRHCYYWNVEGGKDETIVAPPCMLKFVRNRSVVPSKAATNCAQSQANSTPPTHPTKATDNCAQATANGAQVTDIESEVVQTAHSRNAKVHQDSAKSGVTITCNSSKLTKAEERMLRLSEEGIITIKSLCEKLNCKKRNVYKLRAILQEKGLMDREGKAIIDRGGYSPRGSLDGSYFRVHSEQFRIGIIDYIPSYKKQIGVEYHDEGNRIVLWKECVEIYAKKYHSFDAPTTDEAVEASLDYFFALIGRIQNQNRITLLVDKKQNIKLVKFHIARTNDAIAKDVISKGDKFRIYSEDGKLRMIVDTSRGPEMESMGSGTAKPDMNRYEKHVEDLIVNDPPTNSELEKRIKQLEERERPIFEENTISTPSPIVQEKKSPLEYADMEVDMEDLHEIERYAASM